MEHVLIVGTATWGTTLGLILAKNAVPVWLLARTKKEMLELQKKRENKRFLPSFIFPPLLQISDCPAEVVPTANAIIFAVPSRSMRENVNYLSSWISEKTLIVSASKGLEFPEGKRMSQVLEEILPSATAQRIAVLSGPNLAKEIAANHPSSAVVASHNSDTCLQVQELLSTPTFRIYTNEDVLGTELGGSLKNVIAIAAGICDGLSYGDNAKAALLTRGLAEITNLGTRMGAKALTFTGLSGMGDLIATCSSKLSRNHHLGIQLAKGFSSEYIIQQMDNVAEGAHTTAATLALARQYNIEMPITEATHAILNGKLTAEKGAKQLMTRFLKSE
jgi:glycerol-3-phosphate dehydrogenase (NAD(P)+)